MTTETPMIERVARALCLRGYNAFLARHEFTATDEDRAAVIDRDWATHLPDARAAIGAMREPTGLMIGGGMVAPRSPETVEATNSLDRHHCLTRDIYRAMIDAALSSPAVNEREGSRDDQNQPKGG